MLTNIWRTEKKNRKGESSDSEQDVEIIERCRTPDQKEPSILKGQLFDLSLNNRVKKEIMYPDTRFKHSTTLFPAQGTIEEPSETPSESSKRSAEDELISTMPRKRRVSDPPETMKSTISNDCMIIENPKTRVEIEVVDLTGDCHPVVPILCSPVKISYQENRLPDSTLQANGDVHVKVESSEKTEINVDAAIQVKAEQKKADENNSEINTGKSWVDFNKIVDPSGNNPFRIQVKPEKGFLNESSDYDTSSIEHSTGNSVQIKAEKGMSSENNTEIKLENLRIGLGKKAESAIHNFRLKFELDKENEENGRIKSPIPVSNNVSDCIAKSTIDTVISMNRPLNNFPIKMEQNENCLINNNSVSLSNFISDVNRKSIFAVDNPIESQQNKTNENFQSVVSSEMSVTDEFNKINSFPVSNDGDKLYEPGIFQTPLLKYLDCNTKVEILEISHLLSILNNLIGNKEEINLIKSETTDSNDSQYKSELCLTEKCKELRDLQVNEKQSLKINKIIQKISLSNFTELVNFKTKAANLDSNSVSSQVEKSLNESQVQSLLNNDGLSDEMRQNNFPNTLLESHSKISEPNLVTERDSDSQTIFFNTPMDIESSLDDESPFIICLPPLDNNERSDTSSIMTIEKRKNRNELLPNDLLHLTTTPTDYFSNAKITEKSDGFTDIGSSLKSSVDTVTKPNAIMDESLFHNPRQIKLQKNKPTENVNSRIDVNKKKSEQDKSLSAPSEKVFKRSQGVIYSPPTASDNCLETPPKRFKRPVDGSISNSGNVKKLRYKRDIHMMDRPHYSPDQLSSHLRPDFLSNFPDSSPVASNFQQNMSTPPDNLQNSNLSSCSEASLHNPKNFSERIGMQSSGNCHFLKTRSPQDSRLARNHSPKLHADLNSQNPLSSFNISQISSSQIVPEVTTLKESIYPHVKQITSSSTTNVIPNFFNEGSSEELLHSTINAVQTEEVRPMLPQISSFQLLYFNQRTSEKQGHVSPSTSGLISYPMVRYNYQRLIKDKRDSHPFLSFPHLSSNISSVSSHYHLMLQKIPPITRHNAVNYDNYSPESVNYGFSPNPSLPVDNSPPPLPPISSIVEQPHSFFSNISSGSLSSNHNKPAVIKSLPMPNQSSSKFLAPKQSLLPKLLREDIGKSIISTNYVYLIIIERKIDWILGIDKEIGVPKISEIGGEFQKVRDSYANHLEYYNTYFPLLLLEYFSKIATALKAIKQKEKKDRNICRVIKWETKQSCVSFTCDSFIRLSDVENIPKDGHIILVKFATLSEGDVRMLGYVFSSATRAYSHRHDHGHEILKYVNVNKRTDLIKIKITFCTVFGISDINLDSPIHISKLISIKKALKLNDALNELQRSPFCEVILNPRNHKIKNFVLSRKQDTNTMPTVVRDIVKSLNPSAPQLTVVKSAPFSDSLLAIVHIVREIQKSKIPGKILVCVRMELLCQMGMNLAETSSNIIIICRERENVSEKLHSRVLDVKISHLLKSQNMKDNVAKRKVIEEAEVLLAVTGTCIYEDVQRLARDITYCIIHDAQSFTEPESLLPLLYGIRHLILFGDPDELCIVNSKCGASLGFNQSLFRRAYSLC